MSQVDDTGRVFISNSAIASSKKWLTSHGITHIVNCAQELPNYHSRDFRYMALSMQDMPSEPIVNRLDPSYKFIMGALLSSNKNKVLIHCHMGMSRSATIAIHYLMRRWRMTFLQAYQYLKQRHPITQPNNGYAYQLQSISKALGLSRP